MMNYRWMVVIFRINYPLVIKIDEIYYTQQESNRYIRRGSLGQSGSS